MKEEVRRYAEVVKAIEDQVAEKDWKGRLYSRKLALWGFLLVCVGSLMQAAAASHDTLERSCV